MERIQLTCDRVYLPCDRSCRTRTADDPAQSIYGTHCDGIRLQQILSDGATKGVESLEGGTAGGFVRGCLKRDGLTARSRGNRAGLASYAVGDGFEDIVEVLLFVVGRVSQAALIMRLKVCKKRRAVACEVLAIDVLVGQRHQGGGRVDALRDQPVEQLDARHVGVDGHRVAGPGQVGLGVGAHQSPEVVTKLQRGGLCHNVLGQREKARRGRSTGEGHGEQGRTVGIHGRGRGKGRLHRMNNLNRAPLSGGLRATRHHHQGQCRRDTGSAESSAPTIRFHHRA